MWWQQILEMETALLCFMHNDAFFILPIIAKTI
jgi:hypothetical protein